MPEVDDETTITTLTSGMRFLLHDPSGGSPSGKLKVISAQHLMNQIAIGLADTTPDAFSFTPVTDANLLQSYLSNTETITGIDSPAPISITGGEYRINGGAWTSSSGQIVGGQTVQLRVPSSSQSNVTVVSALTIADVVEEYSVTTTDDLWTLDAFPEMTVRGWYQEDLVAGAATWTSRGTKPTAATQANAANRPVKLANNGGVFFAKNSIRNLTWANDGDWYLSFRWFLCIARADMDNNPTADVNVACVHGSSANSGMRQPLIMFNGTLGKFYCDIYDTTYRVGQGDFDGDFANWNVMFGMRRGAEWRVCTNGVWTTVAHTAIGQNTSSSTSIMGSVTNMTADMAIDCLVFGQGILNNAQAEKIIGAAHWRAGRTDLLDGAHPYKSSPPVGTDANDAPNLHVFDLAAWTTFAGTANAVKFEHRGEAAPTFTGLTTVFFDDFATDTVVNDVAGAEGNIWFAPTHVPGIDGMAVADLHNGGASNAAYVQSAAGGGTMAIRLYNSGGWKSGAFGSINKGGHGRTWAGPAILSIRCKFPLLVPTGRPGFFPAFWGYNVEHLFYRTRNRLEFDFFEYDGWNGAWINNSIHEHDPTIIYPHADIWTGGDMEEKIAGYELSSANGFTPTIDIYDGAYHTWRAAISCDGADFYYMILDDKEVFRVATPAEALARKYLLVDWAYHTPSHGAAANTGLTYDMTIDWIKVEQPITQLAIVPTGFSGRPTIAGTTTVGQTLTITPNTVGDQIDYFWYTDDGKPIVTALSNTLVIPAAASGKKIRATVRNLAILDQPEAWTADTATVV